VRCNQMGKTLLLTAILLMMSLAPLVPAVAADQSSPTDMQAQNIAAQFNQYSESTDIMWENIGTQNLTIAQMLQASRYLVYRSDAQMNMSIIENGTIPYIANISACTGNVVTCPSQQHSITHPLPPGVNGTFFYGIATQLDDGSIRAFMEMDVSQTGQPIMEFTHDITAPFSVNATFFPETSKTKIDWINLNQLQPGTLLETGPNAYVSKIYRHLNPASRITWPAMDKQLVAVEPAGVSTTSFDVPPNTDVDAYYSVTYEYLSYEDARFIGGVNTMDEEFPVKEDNVAPLDVEGVIASFIAESSGGTGNTTIAWTDISGESNAVYHIWRSGSPFNNTTNPSVEHIAAIQTGVGEYRYEVERGTLGYAYYAVTASDSRGNHNASVLPSAIAGPIMENAFDPWVAEPTNVQAEYIENAQTEVTWSDQMGAEGEYYHIWHSWTRLSASSNLSLEATLVATVPDGVQTVIVPVEDAKDVLSYYCITSVTRYNHLNATYEDTRFQQNCVILPVREDTLAPAPIQLAQPMLQGSQKTVLLSWMNSLAEENETYTIWRHLGTPFTNNETGNISDSAGWEIQIENYEAHSAETTVLREIYLEEGLNRYTWYALTIADIWGNSRDSLTNRSNAWYVHEDTTAPDAEITIAQSGLDEMSEGALMSGDYRLHIYSNEPLQEFPLIHVSSDDYNVDLGVGTTFTPESEITRATPFLSSNTHYVWDFPIPAGMDTTNLSVTANLIDMVGNSQDVTIINWSIDAESPTIELFSPSYESKYLYGDEITVHGVVSDDVALLQVKYRFTHFGEFIRTEFEWENVTDITPNDAPENTIVFSMKEPASTFEWPGDHRVEIVAIDTAGNQKSFTTSFYVDHCFENLSGLTLCASGDSPFTTEEEETAAAITLTSPPYIIILAVVAFNLLLLLLAITMGVFAAQDPSKKKKGGDEDYDEDDEWMMEFMGGDAGSADAADAGLAELESKPKETKQLDDEGDPFATDTTEKKRRKKSKDVVEEVDDDDFDDDDDSDDEWGDDEDDAPKKKEKKRRPKKAAKRRAVKRKS